MDAVEKPAADAPYLAEFERLNAYLQEQRQEFQADLERTARYHQDVRQIAISFEERFAEIEQELASLRRTRAGDDSLIADCRAALSTYDDRLESAESFVKRVPLLQAELVRKIEEVRTLGNRLQQVDESVSATVERIGGADAFRTIQDVPRRIRHQSDQAREELTNVATDLTAQLQAQLSAVADSGIQSVGEAVNRVLDEAQRQLDRIQSAIDEQDVRSPNRFDSDETVFRETIENSRREAERLREEVSVQIEQCERTVQEATFTIRRDFQQWLSTAVKDIVEPEIEAWREEMRAGLEATSNRLKEDQISTGWRFHLVEDVQEDQGRWLRRLTQTVFIGVVLLTAGALFLHQNRTPEPSHVSAASATAATASSNVAPADAPNASPDGAPAEPVDVSSQLAEEGNGPSGSEAPGLHSEPGDAVHEGPTDPSLPPPFTWIVASTTERAVADSLSRSHRAEGRESVILLTRVNEAMRYRVTLGSFETARAAQSGRGALQPWLPADAWVLASDEKTMLLVE